MGLIRVMRMDKVIGDMVRLCCLFGKLPGPGWIRGGGALLPLLGS